jgi:hypothetical protein
METVNENFFTPESKVWLLRSSCTGNAAFTGQFFLSISVWNVINIGQLLTRTEGQTDGRAIVIQGFVFRGFGTVV